jgi:triosephosphate isomerase
MRSSLYETIVCAPFTDLPALSDMFTGTNVKLGAENVYPKESGAFTGEISPLMLKELNVEYVIVGHSERRHIFNESDELINLKIKKLLEHSLKPIFCVGELLEDRENGLTFNVLEKQVKLGLKGITKDNLSDMVMAYEPVWAIGTGKVATSAQAEEVHAFLRNMISEMYDTETAEKLRILYGGSIKPENFFGLITQKDIDGGLVGGASLKESFFELGKIVEKVVE